MKIKKLRSLRPGALIALGVFLGRGAQADTVLDFDNIPPGQTENSIINQGFGSLAAASSEGVTVTTFGTPNIALTWTAVGASDSRWDYYDDGGSVWTAVQLNDSDIGDTHRITFAPNSASARVVVKSFNLDGYYLSSERFTYNVSVVSGTNVLSGPTQVSFLSDGTKNHPVNVNYTGVPGQTLKLRLDRVASTLGAGEIEGGAFNIAVDDITFAQLPATVLPAGPQVVSVTPADGQTGVAASSYPYLASITNGDTALAAGSIKLKLDYSLVSPPPSISTAAGLTNVSYPGTSPLSSGTHIYTLTYSDNLGAVYTNEVQFSSTYTTLPATYALPSSSGVVRGFTYRVASASTQVTDSLAGSIARAEAQLNGTLINTNTSQPYTNEATLGPNADGSYNVDTVINFIDSGVIAGDFPGDVQFPGLDAGPYNWFSTEELLYLNLPAGYYRFGVNSDDGFQVTALPPQGVSGPPIVLGVLDANRGSADTLFDVLVPNSGIYPFRLVYFESTGDASCEFFSVTNLATGDKVLINDPADGNAVPSFRVLAPDITSIVKTGTNVVLNWAYGAPPFQVQLKTNVTDSVWNNVGSPTPNSTATIPIQPGARFFRIFGQ